MPATKKRSYARYTLVAVQTLGSLVQLERKARRMPAEELATRLGVTRATVARLEKGDPKVEVGLAFEACALLGIPLLQDDVAGLATLHDDTARRLALLPKRARARQVRIDNDF